MFSELYEDHISKALLEAFESPKIAQICCTAIEDQMEYFSMSVDLGTQTAVEAHAGNVQLNSHIWKTLRSQTTCLYCIRRPSDFVLTCEHSICEVCLSRFGSPVDGKPCHFRIIRCILCVTKGSATVKAKPPTADVRVLSVDGGGVGGIVPLEYLALLQRAIGPVLRVQDLFEEAFGTSAGRSRMTSPIRGR